MERRSFMKAGIAAGLVSGSFISSAIAADKKSETKSNESKKSKTQLLQESLVHCLQTGYACIAHCMEQLKNGETEMAECNQTVHDMLATCEAMLKLSSYNSTLAKPMAELCAKACDICAKACEKHKEHWGHGMHLECKACFEACQECSKACRA